MKKIAIVAGEPNSINSEIIGKSWNKISKNKKYIFFVIGNFVLIKKQLNSKKIKIKIIKKESINDIYISKSLQILNVDLNFKDPYKVNSVNSSKYVLTCLDLAHKWSINKKIFGFINCPVDKGKTFKSNTIGVTDYLAKKNNLEDTEVMMIYNKKFSVVPLTTHVPIKHVSKKISHRLIERKIFTLNSFFKNVFKKKPLIAVLGLNPHNAEHDYYSEENKIIVPSINKLKKKGYKVIGPFPADTIFSNQRKYRYDVIVGMYHDQVLGPFKALFNYKAINVTLGLNYIRVSPDHGIAKDIMKLKKANPSSLIECAKFFLKLNND